jgi:hypothetical protein
MLIQKEILTLFQNKTMKILKKSILYLLVLAIIYLGVLNKTLPWVFLLTFFTLGFLLFLWVLKPLITNLNIVHVFKTANYLHDYKLIKLLIFTGGIIVSIWGTEIKGMQMEFNIVFLILKIVVSIILEFTFILSLFRKDISFPLD